MNTARTLLAALIFASSLGAAAVVRAQPIEEGPIEEGPIEEGPVDEGPIDEGPIDEGPIDEGPIDEGPIDEGPVDEGPIEEGPVDEPDDPKQTDPQKAEPEIVPPELVELVEAVYPEKAEAEGIEGVVVLEIDIDAEGKVEAARVLEPAGYGFDEAALVAVRQFRFEPATVDGEPIPVRITYRYGFQLAEEVKEPVEGPEGGPEEGPEAPGVVNFKGRALERGTRDPLIGVLVIVFRGEGEEAYGFEATTDEDGAFEFRDLEPGDWKILIEPSGYYPFRTSEGVAEGELTEVVYFVEKGSYNPFDVLVEGTRPRKEVNRRTLEVAEIEKIPGNFGDPIKVVQNLPGVARAPFGGGEIIVRGSSPEDTKVYVDGIEVPLIYHFGGLRSVVPAGMLQSIDFYPGNFSTYYGRSIGGVLDVDLKSLRPEAIHGYVDVNIYDSGVFLEAPIIDDLSIAVAARRSYIDYVLEAVIPEDAPINLITAPRYYDYQTQINWSPAEAHNLRLFVFGSNDLLRILFENPKDLDVNLQSGDASFETDFVRAILTHTWTPSADYKNTAQVAFGRDVIETSLGDQFYFNLYNNQFSIRDESAWIATPDMTLVAGLDTQISWTDVSIELPRPPKEGDSSFNEDITDTVALEVDGAVTVAPAAYFNLELKATEDLLFIPGFRVDYIDRIGELTYDPRLTARYAMTDQWTLKGGVGLFHQEPPPDETTEGFGNPDLKPEEAIHYSLGAEYVPRDYPALLIDSTLFYKDMRDLVSRTTELGEDGEEEVYNNGGRGRVYGLELLVRHKFANRFFGWVTYTLSRAERLDFGENAWRLFDFDQTHILTVIGSYQLPKNWEIGMRWRLVSGNPFTPIVGGAYNVDLDEYEPITGAVNSARLEPFHQLDLRVDKRWIYDTWTFNAYLDIQNTYNRPNAEGTEYSFDYRDSRPQQGLPILPIIGVRAEF